MTTTTSENIKLKLERHIKAPREHVFKAWIDPKQIQQWFVPCGKAEEHKATSVKCDPRVGGKFRIQTQKADGEYFTAAGTYREVRPPEKLVFTWAWKTTPERESLVTVEIKPDGDGSLLTLTHAQFFDEEARDRHQGGWTGALDKLEKFVA